LVAVIIVAKSRHTAVREALPQMSLLLEVRLLLLLRKPAQSLY
jgi:hypothetical protein